MAQRPSKSKTLTARFLTSLEWLDDRVVPAVVFRSGTAVDAAGITAIRDTFRADLGGGTTPEVAPGSFGGVRREVNWDGVPAAKSAPNNLPANFFNSNSPRGVVFSTPGTGFQVSGATTDNLTGQPALDFSNLNPNYPTNFDAFSPQRLFTSIGSNQMDVSFFVPGTSIPATVNGFGAIFSDVDLAGVTSMEFFFADGSSVQQAVTPTPGNVNGGFSFLGAFDDSGISKITKVRILSGNQPVGIVEDAINDIVVLDDFLFSEPREIAQTAVALSGTSLVTFSTSAPGNASAPVAITGVTAGETLVGIDIRPQNGLLYGLGIDATNDKGTLYAISVRTGVATPVGAAGGIAFTTDGTTPVDLPDPATVGYGIDFNPTVDRIRVVAGSLNFRLNPNTGTGIDGNAGVTGTNPDGAINGATTTVDATAYTNAVPNTTITTQYTIDAATDKLYIQNPPNSGTQASAVPITLAGAPLDFTNVTGFDIPSTVVTAASNAPVTAGSAFATLSVGGTTQLYSIDLVTGAATALGAIAGAATASGLTLLSNATGTPVIALNEPGTQLVRFNTATPGTSTTANITGVTAGETVAAIDFRPQTGQMYGLGINGAADNGTLYLIDPQTGTATVVGTAGQIAFVDGAGAPVDFGDVTGTVYDIDFNPTVDRIRVVTSSGLNFRVNPNTGAAVDGDLGGAAGSVTGTNTDKSINGDTTSVSGTAYTNSFGQSLTGGVTTQYTLDPTTDKLLIQTPPNAGTQTKGVAITEGGAPLDFSDVVGFDIPSSVRVAASGTLATGTGIAGLTVGGTDKLYAVNLTTGDAKFLGNTPTSLFSLTLADNAAAGVISFGISSASGPESGAATITLNRTGSTAGAASVTITFAGITAFNLDYDVTPIVVNFADGQSTATATIPNIQDTIFEGNETYSAILGSPTGGAVLGSITKATITIVDDEVAPTITLGDAKVTEGNTGTTKASFTVTLSGAASKDVTVQVDTLDGTANSTSDYTAIVGQTVTIPAGTTSATVDVTISGDTTFETDETFKLLLSNPTVGKLGATTFGTGTITNDDTAPTISINNVTAAEGNTGKTAFTFSVSLSAASEVPVSVTVDTVDKTAISGKDFTGVSGLVLNFAAGELSKTVTVNVTGDTVNELDETFDVVLSAPTGATLATATGTGTITNDDAQPGLSINDVAVTEGNSGTTAITFTVGLVGSSDRDVTVDLATSDGSATAGTDYTALATQTLTFAPGETTKTVTVNVTGDTAIEPDETFNVTLSNAKNATITDAVGVGTIVNDDAAAITVSIANASVLEGNSGTTALIFTLTLSSKSATDVVATVNTTDGTAKAGSDYAALTGTKVTIPAGNTSATVTVNVTGDTTVEPNETFTITISSATGATVSTSAGTATGTITDDDTASTTSPVLLVGGPRTVIGPDSGAPIVRVVDGSNAEVTSLTPFPASFTGGVRTATADVNNDGTPDIIVASGPGQRVELRVFDGKTKSQIFSDTPFEASFTGGAFVAAGDVNGDGFADIVFTPDRGGGPRVDVYNGKDIVLNGASSKKIDTFFGIEDTNFRGGARPAVGDINGDGIGDVLVAAGFEGGPRVAAFDGTSLGKVSRVKLFNDFFVFEETLRNGAFVGLGDINGDGFADVIAGGGPGGGPRVTVFDAAALITSKGSTRTVLGNFFAGDPATRDGVRIAVKDLDGDNKADIRTVAGNSDLVFNYLGKNITASGTPASTNFDGLPDFIGGAFVG